MPQNLYGEYQPDVVGEYSENAGEYGENPGGILQPMVANTWVWLDNTWRIPENTANTPVVFSSRARANSSRPKRDPEHLLLARRVALGSAESTQTGF